jgi:hypothetical protein
MRNITVIETVTELLEFVKVGRLQIEFDPDSNRFDVPDVPEDLQLPVKCHDPNFYSLSGLVRELMSGCTVNWEKKMPGAKA